MSRRKHKNKKRWWKKIDDNKINGNKVALSMEAKGSGINSGSGYNLHGNTSKYAGVSWLKSCNHGITPIFNLGENTEQQIEFCGATKDQIQTWELDATTLVLNVSGYSMLTASNEMLRGPKEFDILREYIPQQKVKELVLAWADGMSFGASAEFWQRFYDICRAEGYKKVIVCCLGGHGRTGTALAALLIANTEMDDFTAIDFIRKHYCDEAIETKAQENYLERLYFELSPENQSARQAQAPTNLTTPAQGDKIVIDMGSGEVIGNSEQKELTFPKTNLNNYEDRNCAWCGYSFVAAKNNKDDITCSEECAQSAKEFAGYDLRC